MSASISPNVWAIIPAAGIGSRMGASLPKQYLPLLNETVLDITLGKLLNMPEIKGLVIALGKDDPYWHQSKYAQHKKVHTVIGGQERRDSVLVALNWCLQRDRDASAWALVHDAARPCVTPEKIRELMTLCLPSRAGLEGDVVDDGEAAKSTGFSGAILAVPAADTIKRVGGRRVLHTEDRSQLWLAHTPQMFPLQMLAEAIVAAASVSLAVTDESSAIEAFGGDVMIVEDRRDNIKITVAEDLLWAHTILQRQGCKA